LLALTKILPERPDIVVSGVNHGANLRGRRDLFGHGRWRARSVHLQTAGIAVSLAAREGDFTPARISPPI